MATNIALLKTEITVNSQALKVGGSTGVLIQTALLNGAYDFGVAKVLNATVGSPPDAAPALIALATIPNLTMRRLLYPVTCLSGTVTGPLTAALKAKWDPIIASLLAADSLTNDAELQSILAAMVVPYAGAPGVGSVGLFNAVRIDSYCKRMGSRAEVLGIVGVGELVTDKDVAGCRT